MAGDKRSQDVGISIDNDGCRRASLHLPHGSRTTKSFDVDLVRRHFGNDGLINAGSVFPAWIAAHLSGSIAISGDEVKQIVKTVFWGEGTRVRQRRHR